MRVEQLPTGNRPSDEVLLGLSEVPAGLRLATTLSGIDVRQVDQLPATFVIEAQFRQANHERAGVLAWIARFLAFWGPAGRVFGPFPSDCRSGVDEIAALLGLGHTAALNLCRLAWDLQRRLGRVLEAMRAGVLDEPKARAFSEGTTGLFEDHTDAIVDALLDRAPRLSVCQLRDEIAKLATAQDPEDALRRYIRGRDNRRVEGKRNRDGTGTLSGRNMSAVDLATSCARYDRLARKVIEAGVKARLDHVRADIHAGLNTGRYQGYTDEQIIADQVAGAPSDDVCYDGDDWPDPEAPDWPEDPNEQDLFDSEVYGPLPDGPTYDDEPDDEDPPADWGSYNDRCPICADDPERDPAGPDPGEPPDIDGPGDADEYPDLDYTTLLKTAAAVIAENRIDTEPDDNTDYPDDKTDNTDDPGDNRDPDPGATGIGDSDRGDTGIGGAVPGATRVGRRVGRSDGLRLLMTLPTLAGLDRRPGILQPRAGPLHAEAALDLALRLPAWWLVLVDPAGQPQAVVNLRRRPAPPAPNRDRLPGELWLQVDVASLEVLQTLDRIGLLEDGWSPVLTEILDQLAKVGPGAPNGDPAARFPGDSLRRFINLRDLTCTFPGCTVPAYQTQSDHLQDYAGNGPTADFNLGSSCAGHHGLHTKFDWTIRMDAPGHTTWTSPNGRVFHRRPRSTLLNLPKPHPTAWEPWYPHPDPVEPGPDTSPGHCLEPERQPRRGEPENIDFPF